MVKFAGFLDEAPASSRPPAIRGEHYYCRWGEYGNYRILALSRIDCLLRAQYSQWLRSLSHLENDDQSHPVGS